LSPSWKEIIEIVSKLGLLKGIFLIFFISANLWVWRLYVGRIKDRKEEIDRLAQDNREYRERFLSMIDKCINYKKNESSKKE